MNVKCATCKGKGTIQRDGRNLGNGQPYDLVCGGCNGVGHYPVPGSSEDIEGDEFSLRRMLAA